MENSNFQIFKAETLIDQAITSLPVGMAYTLLRIKMLEIKELYLQQVNEEYAAAQVNSTQNQNNAGHDLASAQEEKEQDNID